MNKFYKQLQIQAHNFQMKCLYRFAARVALNFFIEDWVNIIATALIAAFQKVFNR